MNHHPPREADAPVRLDPPPPSRNGQRTPTPPAPRWRVPPPAQSPPPTSAAFTPERMLKPAAGPPAGGWRRALYMATGGLVRVGPSAAEVARRDLIARVKAPVTGCRRVAVISRKGGVGKTTTTLMLGHTFAMHRGDRVVALDANPDAGSLGYRVRRESAATVTDLLESPEVTRYADVRAFTSQAPSRLEVVASDSDPHITQAIGEAEYTQAVGVLEHHYNLILLDTGTGILDSATKGILRTADQLVVVVPPALDGAHVAAQTLDWLDQNGYGALSRRAVAAINGVRVDRRSLVDLDAVEAHFSQRCAATVRIPWDAQLEAGALSGPDDLAAASRHAYLHLAAAVADGFVDESVIRPHPPVMVPEHE